MNRREFIGGGVALAAMSGCRGVGCATKSGPRRIPANAKVNVGIIGCGLIARGTNVPGFLKDPRCRVMVACDMVKVAPEYFYGARKSNFGAHEFDQLQRGLGTQLTGPVAIENMESDYATGSDRDVFSWPSEFKFDIVYANGVRCHVRKIDKENGWPRQTVFHCEKGDVGSYAGKGRVPWTVTSSLPVRFCCKATIPMPRSGI